MCNGFAVLVAALLAVQTTVSIDERLKLSETNQLLSTGRAFANIHRFREDVQSERKDAIGDAELAEEAVESEIDALISQPTLPSIDLKGVIEPIVPTFRNMSSASIPSTVPLVRLVEDRNIFTIAVRVGSLISDPVYEVVPSTGKGLTWFATDAIQDEGSDRICKVPYSTIARHTKGAKGRIRIHDGPDLKPKKQRRRRRRKNREFEVSKEVLAVLATQDVTIGDLTVTSLPVGAIIKASNTFPLDFNATGVLGLGFEVDLPYAFQNLARTVYPSSKLPFLAHVQLQNDPAPLAFSKSLRRLAHDHARKLRPSEPSIAFYYYGSAGCFSVGGDYQKDYRFIANPSSIEWYPATHSPTSWTIGRVRRLLVGSNEYNQFCPISGCVLAVHSGVEWITGPQEKSLSLMQDLQVHPYCHDFTNLPTISLELFDGRRILLEPVHYVFVTKENDFEQCRFGFAPQLKADSFKESTIVLGVQFLKNFYSVFDAKLTRFGYGPKDDRYFLLNGCKDAGPVMIWTDASPFDKRELMRQPNETKARRLKESNEEVNVQNTPSIREKAWISFQHNNGCLPDQELQRIMHEWLNDFISFMPRSRSNETSDVLEYASILFNLQNNVNLPYHMLCRNWYANITAFVVKNFGAQNSTVDFDSFLKMYHRLLTLAVTSIGQHPFPRELHELASNDYDVRLNSDGDLEFKLRKSIRDEHADIEYSSSIQSIFYEFVRSIDLCTLNELRQAVELTLQLWLHHAIHSSTVDLYEKIASCINTRIPEFSNSTANVIMSELNCPVKSPMNAQFESSTYLNIQKSAVNVMSLCTSLNL